MDLIHTLHKFALVVDRASEFIDHNAHHLLPHNKTKMIDMATISLMAYEDHVFHWDQIKNIVTGLVEKKINQSPLWYIDMSQSTSEKVVIKSQNGRQEIVMPIDLFMMTTQLAIH